MKINTQRIVALFIIAVCSCLLGCTDDLLEADPDVTKEGNEIPSAILIDGEENDWILPTQVDVRSLDMKDADFLTLTKDGKIYCERNDGDEYRIAKVYVTRSNGQVDTVIYRQAPASRAAGSSLRQFYRHHGIGYSYNAVSGSYCNLRDFRCQILNRAVIDRISDEQGLSLLNVNPINDVEKEHEVYTSVVDYIAQVNVDASASGDLVFFSGSASKTCAIFEDGVKESYILHNKISSVNAEYSLNYKDISLYANRYPSLLTSSFRNAISKIDDKVSIDEFIYTYGTHVVVFSKLGARMTLDVQIDSHKFESREYEEALSKATIETLFKTASSSSSYVKNYQTLKDSKCSFNVIGGDVTLFDRLIGFANFDNTTVPAKLDAQWLNSVHYDDDDLAKSNVELIDMQVIPIWEFIPDKVKALKVEGRVTGNMKLAMDMVPNRNFINTSFEAHPTSVTCRIGDQDNQRFNNPDVVDIIAANRHVATICKEYVPELSQNNKVQVAYPIYEGKVKLSNGLCIHEGKAYKVDWRYDKFIVSEIDTGDHPVDGQHIYMNGGVLSAVKSTNIEYQKSYAILGCERPGGIAIDGSVKGEIQKVFKHFGHFYLDNNTRYDNLPGWEYSTTPPDEAKNYAIFFPGSTYQNRMVRSGEYVYLLNPKEIGYKKL